MNREDEALQVLADLHGGGDKKNEMVVFEYEEIRQQVCFLTCSNFPADLLPRYILNVRRAPDPTLTYLKTATHVVSFWAAVSKCGHS